MEIRNEEIVHIHQKVHLSQNLPLINKSQGTITPV